MNTIQAMAAIIREARRERGTVAGYKRLLRALRILGFNDEDATTILIPVPLPRFDFNFRLRGHGQDLDGGTYNVEDEKTAFKAARRKCSFLELPGWSLHCVETGTTLPVVEVYDEKDVTKAGNPKRKYI